MDRRAAVLVAALIALSGCAGTSTNQGASTVAPPIQVRPGLWLAGDLGGIEGQVLDDAGLPVPQARLSVLGTDLFQDADPEGRFLLVNVTTGPQRVQAFAPGHVANESLVTVTAGNITNTTLYLIPDANAGAGYTPHLHDFWGGADEYRVMDNDQDFRSGGRPEASKSNLNNTPSSQFDAMRIKLPESAPGHPSIILPGTREIQVRLTWTSTSSTLTKMGIRYSPPGVSPLSPLATAVRESGQTLHIPVTPEQADTGHQLFSYWMFFLCPCNDPRYAPNYQPGALLGPIHIEITLIRGNVELEPGHPDFWQGKEQLLLLPGEWKSTSYTNGNERSPSSNCYGLPQPALLPPGTTHATFELRWRYQTANNTPLDQNWLLTWRTGDQDPGATTFDKFRRAPGTRGDHHIVYNVEIPAAQTDSYYQKRTNWCWLPSVEGQEDSETSTDVGRGHQVWLRVEAFRRV